jgi:hypothetical protein
MKIVTTVLLSREVTRDLDLLPPQILKKFRGWVTAVEIIGLRETRKVPSLHDEPLQGKRVGQ